MSLLNKKDIQGILINLDKRKSRERNFRQYLDDNSLKGISKKESILRLFEMYQGNIILNNEAEDENVDNEIKEDDLIKEESPSNEETDLSKFV